MVTYDELNAQNDKITELSNVLTKLLEDRFLCDSTITSELFFRYGSLGLTAQRTPKTTRTRLCDLKKC